MPCIFCQSDENLTAEHIFPAFIGGELELQGGSCLNCNGDFSKAEGKVKQATIPLLNLLQIENRNGLVPNAPLKNVQIQGMDMKNLPAFVSGNGKINLRDTVKESVTDDGLRLRQGLFLTKKGSEKFLERAHSKGLKVIEREVPEKIVIEAEYMVTIPFAFSVEARKIAAKIALTAIAYEYGIPFALSPQFDALRQARTATGDRDLPVWIFANEGLMSAHLRTAHQHSVMCYMSAGMQKGWAVVTIFGGLTYIMEVAPQCTEPVSRQFSIFFDAESKKRIEPILLADEMKLIGHVLYPASKFEDRDAVDAQWCPIISEFCNQRGFSVSRIRDGKTVE